MQVVNIISFDKNKIILNENFLKSLNFDSTKYKVISIIGTARSGKSTLLNLLITFITGKNSNVFESSSSNKHCTRGIDMYITNNMIFLDCQGIEYQDSSNDVYLLLMSWLFSNLIIYNNTSINNSTLKSLEPIVSFANYIKSDKYDKPNLIIRVRDYDLDENVNDTFSELMKTNNDQYQTIRDSIKNLFWSTQVVSTNILDRKEIKLLKENSYTQILDSNENGINECFVNCVDKIQSSNSVTLKDFVNKLQTIVSQLNENQYIDFHKLNVSEIIITNSIHKFIENVDKSMFSYIAVDGTQQSYNDNVVPRETHLKQIIDRFDNEFSLIDETIKNSYRSKLIDDLTKPINDAINELDRLTIIEYEKFKEENDYTYSFDGSINYLDIDTTLYDKNNEDHNVDYDGYTFNDYDISDLATKEQMYYLILHKNMIEDDEDGHIQWAISSLETFYRPSVEKCLRLYIDEIHNYILKYIVAVDKNKELIIMNQNLAKQWSETSITHFIKFISNSVILCSIVELVEIYKKSILNHVHKIIKELKYVDMDDNRHSHFICEGTDDPNCENHILCYRYNKNKLDLTYLWFGIKDGTTTKYYIFNNTQMEYDDKIKLSTKDIVIDGIKFTSKDGVYSACGNKEFTSHYLWKVDKINKINEMITLNKIPTIDLTNFVNDKMVRHTRLNKIIDYLKTEATLDINLIKANPEFKFYNLVVNNKTIFSDYYLKMLNRQILVFVEEELETIFNYDFITFDKFKKIFINENDIVLDFNNYKHHLIINKIVDDHIMQNDL